MTLAQKLEQFRRQSEELAKTIEEISAFVIVSRSKRIDIIQRCVCEMVGIPLVAMQSTSRKSHFVEARWIAYYVAREITRKSYEEIADNFRAGTDHATLIYGIRELEKRCSVDPKLASNVAEIKAECQRRIDTHELPLFAKAKKPKTNAK